MVWFVRYVQTLMPPVGSAPPASAAAAAGTAATAAAAAAVSTSTAPSVAATPAAAAAAVGGAAPTSKTYTDFHAKLEVIATAAAVRLLVVSVSALHASAGLILTDSSALSCAARR